MSLLDSSNKPDSSDAQIRRTRQQSNDAIARHDASAASAYLHDDAMIITSGATLINGRSEMTKAFETMFKRSGFQTLIRRPERIMIAGVNAAEYGEWTGYWGPASGRSNTNGIYLARWTYDGECWRALNENYAPLNMR